MLTHDGARTGMITTKGYRDILHIGRHQRPQHYSIRQEIPWQNRPLVKRRHRNRWPKLCRPKGEVLVPLDETEVRDAAQALRARSRRSPCNPLLFYLDPGHEERARRHRTGSLPGQHRHNVAAVSPRSASSAVRPPPSTPSSVRRCAPTSAASSSRWRPRVAGRSARDGLERRSGRRDGRREAYPDAALGTGGRRAGRRLGGRPVEPAQADHLRRRRYFRRHRHRRRSRIATATALLDRRLSAARADDRRPHDRRRRRLDRAGRRRRGLPSRSRAPAHVRGRPPTVWVARAHRDGRERRARPPRSGVLSGRRDAARSRRGDLSHRRARRAGAEVAEPPRACSRSSAPTWPMPSAPERCRRIDPRDFALVAFGGAGPLHAVDVAIELGIPEVIVPPHPGINSAIGLLTTSCATTRSGPSSRPAARSISSA